VYLHRAVRVSNKAGQRWFQEGKGAAALLIKQPAPFLSPSKDRSVLEPSQLTGEVFFNKTGFLLKKMLIQKSPISLLIISNLAQDRESKLSIHD
jgi:hypothetical protein